MSFSRFISLLFLILLAIPAFAQLEIQEGSFKEVPGFVNINTEKMYDDNDKPYAVLKIKTENIDGKQRRELNFGGDAQTFFEVEYKDGEVWLYISYYASYIKISHDDLSSTEFYFPFDMKPKKGYEMTLVNNTGIVPIVPIIETYNFMVVSADQPNATIYIDNEYVGDKEVYKSYKAGETHQWRIECDLYHEESGEITIPNKKGENVTVEKKLRPAFGYISVTSSPENGAVVFIDDKKVGETPYTSDKIASGEHKVRVVKEMYSAVENTFTVTDGNTTQAALTMNVNFVNVTITTDSESDIYIDNEKKGKGIWTGRLNDGAHSLEARKTSHKSSYKTVQLTIGRDENVVIPDPEPIYGTLEVASTPIGARILIDNKDVGITPRVIADVLIGKHTITIEKRGYNSHIQEITIAENKKTDLNVTLSIGKEIIVTTNGKGDKIFIDGKEVGMAPLKIVLSYGKHTIGAYNGNKSASKDIVVEKQGGISSVNLTMKKQTLSGYASIGYKFLTLNASINQYSDFAYGFTLGGMKRFGWFVSMTTNFKFDTKADYECDAEHYVTIEGMSYYPEYSGVESYSSLSVMSGILMRLSAPFAMRIGLGYGMRTKRYETVNGYWVKNTAISAQGIDVSLGLQCNFRGFIVSTDCVTTNFKTFEFKIGIGYGLKNK